MAVDSTLISGAYKANKPQGVIGNKEIANITGSITKGLNTYMAAVKTKHTVRNAEYDAFSESVLDNSELVGGQYEALYDELSLGKEDFASADKKGRDLQVRDLKAMAGDYADYKALREDVAINKDDLSPAFTNSPEGEMYLDILKGDGKNLIKKDGRIGIEVEGEWKSISSIKQSLDGNKIDTASIDQLEAFRIKTQANDDDFDFDKTRTTLMNSMVSKGKYKSLINDEIIPGRVFRSDLVESLTNKSYSDLGITEEDLLKVEGVDISDGIDAEEAETIATHLEQDEIEMKEVLADYYTTYVGNNGGSKSKSSEYSEELPEESSEELSEEPAELLKAERIQELFNENPDLADYFKMDINELREKVEANERASSTDLNDGESVDDEGAWVDETSNTDNSEVIEAASETSWGGPALNEQQSAALSPLSISNKGTRTMILVDGKKIIMKGIKNPTSGMLSDVSVDGVRAEGTSIVIDSNFGERGFGKFNKKGNKYVWVGDKTAMKMFEENATPKQKTSFREFIALVERDPSYAESLVKHIGSGKGSVSAATLK